MKKMKVDIIPTYQHTSMDNERVLSPVSRNYIKVGDWIRMKDGDITKVEFLEFLGVLTDDLGWVKKKDVDCILEEI